MEKTEEFSISYWGKEFDYTNPPKKHKKIKRNFMIFLLFAILTTLTPALIFNINKTGLFSKKTQISTSTKIVSPSRVEKIASAENPIQGTVIKNDSYWKISKRYCGTGEFYLSIQEMNNFKALYENDSVTVVCH